MSGCREDGHAGLAVITGATGALGTILYFLATHEGFLAVTAVLTSLYPAVTIVLARIVLGERLTRLRLAGPGTGGRLRRADRRRRGRMSADKALMLDALRRPAFQRGQPEFELVDAMTEDLELGLVGQPPFRGAAQPG